MSHLRNDDAVPDEATYPYLWSAGGNTGTALAEFVDKYRPSMVQDDGSKPWIWVHSDKQPPADVLMKAVDEAIALLDETTQKVQKIQDDPSVPVRANKKKGLKSKKELREVEQAQATEKLKEISINSSFVSGKWLVFSPADRVDAIWASIAKSLASGPLSKTVAYAAKVATTPKDVTPSYQHVVCIYIPDVYDKTAVTNVFTVLLRNHGVTTNGVKSNLYTYIGLDSKHPSGIPSTVWKNTAVLPDTEIKHLKDAYFKELSTSKARVVDGKPSTAATSSDHATANEGAAKSKPLLTLKRKAGQSDPFASDSDDSDPGQSSTAKVQEGHIDEGAGKARNKKKRT